MVTASGLSAITMALCAFASAGDHVLVTDSVYGPTRRFCHEVLSRWGVETTFYDPAAGGNIAGLFRENTRLVFLEAPGSLTFEMQDVPAIARAARAAGILTAMDNTWATPLFFQAARSRNRPLHPGRHQVRRRALRPRHRSRDDGRRSALTAASPTP